MLLRCWAWGAVLGENMFQAGFQLCSIDRRMSGSLHQSCCDILRTCTEIAPSSSSSWTPSTPFLRPCRVAGSGVSGRGESVRNSSMSRFMPVGTSQRVFSRRGKYPTATVKLVVAFTERVQEAGTRVVAAQTPSVKGRQIDLVAGPVMSSELPPVPHTFTCNGHHGSHTSATAVY